MSNPTHQPPAPAIVLASTSPYRQMLLARLGMPFVAEAPGVVETPRPGELPLDLSIRLAREKAEAVAVRHPDAIVIGSDQVAICAGRLMGKPGTADQALAQLQWQRGRSTLFHTAVCLLGPEGRRHEAVVSTEVRWRSAEQLSDARLQRYIEQDQPLDCAGAAKSEALGVALIEAMQSDDPTALVGLPMILVADVLSAWGRDPIAGSD